MGTITWHTTPHYCDERRADDTHLGRITTGDEPLAVTVNGIDYTGCITAERTHYAPVRWIINLFRTNHQHRDPRSPHPMTPPTNAAIRQITDDLARRFPAAQIAQPLSPSQLERSAIDQVKALAAAHTLDMLRTCQTRLHCRDLPLTDDQIRDLVLQTARQTLTDQAN